jgi:hypothetical protein
MVRFVAFGAAFAKQEVRLSDGSGGRFDLVLGGGSACLVRPVGPFGISGCTSFEAGSMSAEGFGVAEPGRESVTWLAPRVEVRGEVVLVGELRAVAGLGATFPLTRHNFVLNDSRSLHRASAITGRLVAGLSFAF